MNGKILWNEATIILVKFNSYKLLKIFNEPGPDERFNGYGLFFKLYQANLKDYEVNNENKKLSFEEIIDSFASIAVTLAYLNCMNYIHWNLKPANILVNVKNNKLPFYLSDFE